MMFFNCPKVSDILDNRKKILDCMSDNLLRKIAHVGLQLYVCCFIVFNLTRPTAILW